VKTRHFAQLVALSALWGASFMFLRIASPVFGPNVMAALRLPAGYSALLNSTAVAPLKLLTSAGPLVSLQPPFYWRSSSAEPLSNACCPRG